jgi:radical SAM superfamily enzyme YgiQ (UPF0313 family)
MNPEVISMAKITICNMIATKRRSASDLFLENGIGILKSHLETRGHRVEPLDLATSSFYKKISPALISRLVRSIYEIILWNKDSNKHQQSTKVLFGLALMLQKLNTAIRKNRMRKQLALIADRIVSSGDKIFGIKVWYGESFQWADKLAQMIQKRSSSILVIAGGYHPSLYESDFMQHSHFDLAVTGEGEHPLEQILNLIDDPSIHGHKEQLLQEIRQRILEGRLTNTMVRDARDDLKVLHTRVHPKILEKAIPRFDLAQNNKMRVHIVVDSLGCAWGKCHFCVHSKFFSQMVPRDPVKIVDEIQTMTEQGIGLFRFSGSDTFPGFGVLIAKEILRRRLDVRYTIGARATKNAADPAIFEQTVSHYEQMIRSGMLSVFMGGETGNDWVNEHVMNKGITSEDIRWTIRAMRKAEQQAGQKLYISLAFIYPTPTLGLVTLEQVFEDNLDLVRETKPDSVMVTPPSPFKQSTWYKKRRKFGFVLNDTFVQDLMKYEYVLYKPVELWPDIGIRLDHMDFKTMMIECGRLRKAIEQEGIETDVSDEHFLMLVASGYSGKANGFKRQSMLDIISGDYRWSETIERQLNRFSKDLAKKNRMTSIRTGKPFQ